MSRNDKYGIDPSTLSELDEERSYINKQTNTFHRVKIGVGESWLVRFLPARLGPKKTFFARIAQHWCNKEAVMCIRNTGANFGGDPDFECPVCAAINPYLDDSKLKKAAFLLTGNSQYRMFCTVKQIDDGRDIKNIDKDLKFTAHEITLSKIAAEEIMSKFKRRLSKSPLSIMDFEIGNDFWIKKTPDKRFHFDMMEESPIYKISDPDKLQKRIDEAMASIHFSAPDVPTDEELEEFADKCLDSLGAGRRSRSRRDDFDEDEEDDKPKRSQARVSSDDDDDDEPRRPASAKAAADDDDDDAPARPARAKVDEDEDDEVQPKAKASRSAHADSAHAEEDEDDEDEPKPKAPLPKAAANKLPPPPASRARATVSDDDDDIPMGEGEKETAPAAADTSDLDDEDEPAPAPAKKKAAAEDLDDDGEQPEPIKRKASSVADRIRKGTKEALGEE